jgi:peptidoglycan-associated lipoprotein
MRGAMEQMMLIRRVPRRGRLAVVVLAAVMIAACGKKQPPVPRPAPPPDTTAPGAGQRTPTPPEPVREAVVPPEPIRDDAIASSSLDDLNRNSPLKPLFFEYDSSEITEEGRTVLDSNATLLKRYPTWAITIEGHCDERGTAEYNLALGERRAVTTRSYLVSLGIPGDRLRTVSYGKEFPFDPAHTESAYSKNRRAHFVITAK